MHISKEQLEIIKTICATGDFCDLSMIKDMIREIEYLRTLVESFRETGCAGLVPDTWIMCGEKGDFEQYCSERCLEEAKIKQELDELNQKVKDSGVCDICGAEDHVEGDSCDGPCGDGPCEYGTEYDGEF